MSWWWNSKPSSASERPLVNETIQKEAPTLPASHGTAIPPASTAEPVKRALSRDEQSNQELIEFLRDIQARSDAEQAERARLKDAGTAAQPEPVHIDISPDSLYPTELSCRSAFDYAMFCQSFGGQFVNIYRYGSFRSCSNHWDDFWLCMRTRNWNKEDRERAIWEHNREKAVKWKTGPSSEDVWEVRTEPVKDAISGNLVELEAQIAAWKKANPGVSDPWVAR